MTFYNENDPKAAAWLRELIAGGHIAGGVVDERSIETIDPEYLHRFIQCHSFAGIGGWSLALRLAGWPDTRPVWTGSCPCQPFSNAGKGEVDNDKRHLWPAFRDLIAECRPAICFGEQVESKDGRIWLAGVRADLEELGFGSGAADLCAAGISAPHIRPRLFWLAHDQSQRRPRRHGKSRARHAPEQPQRQGPAGGLGVADRPGREPGRQTTTAARHGSTAEPTSDPGRLDDGERDGRRAGRDDHPGHERLESSAASGTGGLEHSTGDGREQRGAEPRGRSPVSGCSTDGLADLPGTRLQEREGQQEIGKGTAALRGGAAGGLGHAPGFRRERLPEGARGESEGQSGTPGARSKRRPVEQPTGTGPWDDYDIIPCRDGKARRVPRGLEPSIFLLADGFFYRMATVRAAFYAQAINRITEYATSTRSDPDQVLSLVQQLAGSGTIQWTVGGQGSVPEAEVLLNFVRDVVSAFNGPADGSGSEEESAEADDRDLPELRSVVETQCSSYRRESEEQRGGEPTNPLHVLSWFLARCGQASGYSTSREDAATFPLARGVKQRVGLLRGYGNAIVPPLAAEFIKAVMDLNLPCTS